VTPDPGEWAFARGVAISDAKITPLAHLQWIATSSPGLHELHQEFLHRYERSDEPQRATTLEPWLMSLLVEEDTACSLQHETRVLQLPSGRTAYVTLCAFPLFDAHKQAVGSVSVFHDITHRYQKALHLQRVHQAVSTLREAIAHIPEQLDVAPLRGSSFCHLRCSSWPSSWWT